MIARTPSTRRTLGAAAAAAALLAVAGCGGDDSDPTTTWAGDVCAAVSAWRSGIADMTSSLTANPTRAGLEQAAADARATTQTLIETVHGLGAPQTPAGSQARAAVETLADELDADVATIRDAVDDVTGVQGILAAASTVSAAVTRIANQLSTTIDELSSLRDADDQLRQAFSDADACDGVIPPGS